MQIGIDEVGRGCWAGPLVVGAVAFTADTDTSGLTDSKLLSAKKRSSIAGSIQATSICSLGWVSAQEIDRLGLTAAIRLAITRALAEMPAANDIIIDGAFNFLNPQANVRTMVQADKHVAAVSAASIIAKVARDTHMQQLAVAYAGYGFETNMGYGTARHRAAIQTQGITPIHRRLFRPISAVVEQAGCLYAGS